MMLRLTCGHVSKGGRRLEEKLTSINEMKGECNRYCEGDLTMWLGDSNGHISRHSNGRNELMEGMVFGRKNITSFLSEEGIMCAKYMVYERGKEGDIQNERKCYRS